MLFHLQSPETGIGREPGCDVRIDSGYVSKHHAAVRIGSQGYTLADLGSSNGTYVNGHRVTLAVLKDGDRVEIGSEVLVFSTQAAGAPAPGDGAGRNRRPLMIAIVGGGGLIVLVLLLLIVSGGSSTESPDAAGTALPAGVSPGSDLSPAPATTPLPVDPYRPPPASEPLGTTPATPPLPSNDPAALYEMALLHVKGNRLVEARQLLQASLRLNPNNASAQQRLQEVEVTINVMVDRHLAAGQRAFTYLRYEDAVFEWEQALSMTDASDPRYQQATAGVQRARERLGRR